ATNIVRGPYLQMGSSDGMTIRWRTNLLSNSQVRYGTSIDNLNVVVDSATEITDHEIRLTGLNPQTIYYYSVGNSTDVLADGAGYQFETSPSIGTRESTRIWVIGDAGTANSSARAVYDAYQAETGAAYTDLWLMLGDNAYNSGTDTEYQAAVFDLYPELLRKTPVWSTLGNHDGYSADSDTETGPYYDIFTLPRQAEAGGVASGTEAYYSFDHGNIHFVVLDSYETIQSTTANATMLQWLETDLLNSDAEWTIAFWHHPPYSKGSHDSDTDTRMTKMREQVLPIIENHGVDLVLGGHSHAYERSKFIDGHYGIANTLTLANQIDAGSGRTDGTGAYHKDEIGSSRTGAVYVVAGSSGKLGGGTFDHNAMFLSLRQLGSMILEVDGLTLNASFLDSTGVKQDYFTITKTNATVDSDSDGITDDVDNCLAIANADQANNDADADGDVCDADDDNDGVDDGLDAFPFNANETSDNDGDGTGDNGDLDDDNDGMPDTWEIDNGFNPLDSSDALQDTDRDGVSNLDEYLAGSNPNDPYFTWDIDGDGEVKPLTDGLLNLRYHFGFRGDTLTNSAVGSGAIRSTASDIESYIADAIIDGDIDGDDTTKPLTDGLLLLRYLFGFRGDTLIQNAIAGDAIRQSASEIEAYTASKMP
ncbi:MAG: metallophosphoesterase family protein, partial [Thiotrichaceae bacterium]